MSDLVTRYIKNKFKGCEVYITTTQEAYNDEPKTYDIKKVLIEFEQLVKAQEITNKYQDD